MPKSPSTLVKSKSPVPSKNNNDQFFTKLDSTLEQLFYSMLKEIYWCENHLIKSLPKMIDSANSLKLQKAIATHLEETRQHASRLEKAFEILGVPVSASKCDACEGLVLSGEQAIENTPSGSPTRNIGILMSSLKVESFEITTYEGLINIAEKLNKNEVIKLLNLNLSDEIAASEKLNLIANAS
jgi:ferritin-like metal-binding protein YciE